MVLDSNDIGSKDFGKGAGVVVEKRLAHIVEVGGTKLYEHLKFRLLNFFKYVFFIV